MDQTGRFSFQSRLVTQYFMICYDYDSNATISIELKSREELELLQTYNKLQTYVLYRGLKPQIQRLINEISIYPKRIMEN